MNDESKQAKQVRFHSANAIPPGLGTSTFKTQDLFSFFRPSARVVGVVYYGRMAMGAAFVSAGIVVMAIYHLRKPKA